MKLKDRIKVTLKVSETYGCNKIFTTCRIFRNLLYINKANHQFTLSGLNVDKLIVIFNFSQFLHKYLSMKSLNRSNRQFGLNIKNIIGENELDSKLNLKPKPKKMSEKSQQPFPTHRPEMKYSDQILKYALTTITYPHILKGPQKVKKDIQSLLFQVTSINGQNCLWHQDFLTLQKSQKNPFYNRSITLQKRSSLIEWLMIIHKKYTLREETLHLTVKLIDDHCIKNDIPLKRYQLIGVAALFIAAKFEEIQLPKFKDYHRLLSGQFSAQEMRMAESQILCKTHFLLTKKITTLWYLQAFALQNLIFSGKVNYAIQNKQNLRKSSLFQGSNSRFSEFVKFCNYILNLILLDYKISLKHKEDIISISTLIFTTCRDDYADTDGQSLLTYFCTTKQKLIEENESAAEIKQQIKKCVKKIQQLFKKRFEKKFKAINQKFQMEQKNY